MTNAEIYYNLVHIRDAITTDAEATTALDALARKVYDEMRKADNASDTTAAAMIRRMLKRAEKQTSNQALWYAWTDADGMQCTCDGFRAYRLRKSFSSLPQMPENVKPYDVTALVKQAMQNNKTRVPYTDRGEVKAFIELQHAKHGRNHTPLWEMGCDLPSVNAAYLYEMLTIFPDAAIYANVDSPYSPLYFVSTMGDGILLPVRTPIRRREPTAAQIISAAIEKNPACPEISLDQLAVIAKEYGAA